MGATPSGISGSRIAQVLNVSPYGDSFSIWRKMVHEIDPGKLEKLGIDPPEPVDNAAVKFGLALEPGINKVIDKKMQCNIYDIDKEFIHPEHDFIRVHIDGKIDEKTNNENKTVNHWGFRRYWTDGVPIDVQCQCHLQMACTGADVTYVHALELPRMQDDWFKLEANPTNNEAMALLWPQYLDEMGFMHQFKVDRSEAVENEIIKVAHKFWHENVLAFEPPTPRRCESLLDMLKLSGGTVIADEKCKSNSKRYDTIKAEASILKLERELLKTEMLQYIGDKIDIKKNNGEIILTDEIGKRLRMLRNGRFY